MLTLAFYNQQVKASNAVSPHISVVPESTVDPALTPGMNYTISVYTDYNGSDVWGYEFVLTYNPLVLEGIEVVNGDLITGDVGTMMWLPGPFNNTSGELELTGNGFFFVDLPPPVASGPGTLANITFTVVGLGDSYITLGDETRLIGYDAILENFYDIIDSATMPNQIHHGFFSNVPPPIHDIHIRADGSIDPPTANITTVDNITYTFIGNINESIVVERDNIMVDGTGYTVKGTGTDFSKGIDLAYRSNVTIKNIKIRDFNYGIYLYRSSNNCISQNKMTPNNVYGIRLYSHCNNNTISGNIISDNVIGIYLRSYCNNNTVSSNDVHSNLDCGVYLDGSSNNTISENNITNNGWGIILGGSSYNTISGNNITNTKWGIKLNWDSDSNTIFENNLSTNMVAISLDLSDNNTISRNILSNNVACIYLGESTYNSISENNIITSNNYGIMLGYHSYGNSVFGNYIAANGDSGIALFYSHHNTIHMNNITNHSNGIWLMESFSLLATNSTIITSSTTHNRYVMKHQTIQLSFLR
jgi:parallel beta-helix repeat protein